MQGMFLFAEAFNQTLCWDMRCVRDTYRMFGNDYSFQFAVGNDDYEPESPGSTNASCTTALLWPPTCRAELEAAIDAWVSNASVAEVTYGHISSWRTGLITDMSYLFCGHSSAGDKYTAATRRTPTSTRT